MHSIVPPRRPLCPDSSTGLPTVGHRG